MSTPGEVGAKTASKKKGTSGATSTKQGKWQGEHPAARSTPEIHIQHVQPMNLGPRFPSPNAPWQTQSASQGTKGKDGRLSPASSRPRANSDVNMGKDERDAMFERIMAGFRHVNNGSTGDGRPYNVVFRAPKDLDRNSSGKKNSLGDKKSSKDSPGSKNSSGGKLQANPDATGGVGAGKGKGQASDDSKPSKGAAPGKKPARSKSQENLTVPSSNGDQTKPGKKTERASSVPRHKTPRRPPLFDVQKDGGNRQKARLADEWFEKHENLTQRLVASYSQSKYDKVRVAVLDTGVENATRSDKPEFIRQHSRQIKGWTFLEGGNDKFKWNKDANGHGTHVVGLILRVAPRAEIYSARILKGWESTIDPANVEEALKHCIDVWKVDIISMSFGFDKAHAGIEAQLHRASGKHILVFAAASNDGATKANNIAWPAREKNVFCVFSATGEGANSSFNPPARPGLNFATLGEEVESDWPLPLLEDAERESGVSTKRKSGTSFATPIAAGIAALVLEFARQPPVSKKPEVAAQLKRLARMEEVFERMSERKSGRYNWIYPWKWMNADFLEKTSDGVGGKDHHDAENGLSARGQLGAQLMLIIDRHVPIFDR